MEGGGEGGTPGSLTARTVFVLVRRARAKRAQTDKVSTTSYERV